MKNRTTIPKRELINLIKSKISDSTIREILKINQETSVDGKLNSLLKTQLIDLIKITSNGPTYLEELEHEYPLGYSPTLYVAIIQPFQNYEEIIQKTREVLNDETKCELFLGDDRSIRKVYISASANLIGHIPTILEIPIAYERKIEIRSTEEDDYGELKTLFDLRRGFIWISKEYKHGLIACNDFPAVNPILRWGKQSLDLRWGLPNMSEELLNRLTIDAKPRTATFSLIENGGTDYSDIKTISVSDPQLERRSSFIQISSDKKREQTSGFYIRHPDLVFGGLGISRRFGRIWTPAKISKLTLLAMASGMISKTEKELDVEYKNNLPSFIKYYRNIEVKIAGKKLTDSTRDIFDQFISKLVDLIREDRREINLSDSLIFGLIKNANILDLGVTLIGDCENCNDVLLKCPICGSPYEPRIIKNAVSFECLSHPQQAINFDQPVKCECGAEVNVLYPNNILIYPGLDFIQGLQNFLINLQDLHFYNWFVIEGFILRVIQTNHKTQTVYSLSDFQKWRLRAHHHVRNIPSEYYKKKIIAMIGQVKEKCGQFNFHPKQEDCKECFKIKITKDRINKQNLCLPRIMGYVIGEEFDGIHHGNEGADVQFDDISLKDEQHLQKIGIHLKGRIRSKPKGLGRSSYPIKSLYAQLFYSVYQKIIGNVDFDILGISIPNRINQDTINSLALLMSTFGIPFIIVDETDWVRIFDAVLEELDEK